MNNDSLLNTILTSISINELLEKMDETQKNNFLREIFNSVRREIEWFESGLDTEVSVSFVGYDEESNSIIVSKEEFITEYSDYGALEVPIGLGYRYNISIDKLQNRINSLLSSKQTKVK